MAKSNFLPRLGMLFMATIFLMSCAPAVTTAGSTPTFSPTNTARVIEQSTETPLPEIEVGVVEVDLLNIREGPGTSYTILGSLNKGEKFYILGDAVNSTNNRWLLISLSDKFLGWVIGDQTYVSWQQEIVDLTTYLIWQRNMEAAKSVLLSLTPTPQ